MIKKRYILVFSIMILFGSCSVIKKTTGKSETSNRLAEADQKKFDYLFYEGLRLKNEGLYDQALEAMNMCYRLDSLDAGVLSELGLLYSSVNMDDEALRCFEKAIQSNPSNWWYNLQLITSYAQLNKPGKAITVAENLQKTYPVKEEVYQILASLYKQNKQYEKAIAAFDKLENITGIDESLAIEKFNLYREIHKPKKAIAEIDKLVQKYPTESRYRVVRGDIYMQQKMPEKAFEIYREVLASDPENPYLYVSLSDYYNEMNEPEKATEAIVKALKIDQLAVEQKIDILGQYVQKLIQDTVKLDETESLFKLLVDRYPLEEQVHGYYAVFLQFRKRNTEAISELESMLNINPKNEQTWFQLIQLYLADRNYQQLMDVTARAIENLPKVPQWYFYRGITQFQLKEYEAALKTNMEALPLITEKENALKTDIYAQIGDIYFKLGKKEQAFEAYEEALKINPNNIFVMNNYAYYLSEEKTDLKKAEKMSAKTVEKEPNNSTYLDTYAWIFYQQENYSLAKFYIERAVDNLQPGQDPEVIYEHYGDILWKTGDEAKALEMWKKSVETGNDSETLKLKIENKGMK
ncbi:MAG: tetratricopeptide repeat protein [Bacteroidales bacterium]|nr:tetratricopeptide repeat protein [Bacteroidales bacterium]